MDEVLPEELRDPYRIYDSKGVDKLMTEIARKYPDQYPKITKLLGDIGRGQAWRRGETFRLHDFDAPIDRSKFWAQLDQEETAAFSDLDPTRRNDRLAALYERLSGDMQRETGQAAMAKRNNIALSVLTGARGKDAQMRDLISSPGFYPDGRGGVVPGFVRNSFAEGLRPYEYLSSSFASRAAVTDSKKCLLEGTLVRMADGSEKEIQNLKVGDLVVGVNREGITSPTRVINVFAQGPQQVNRYSFRFGNSDAPSMFITCTETHKMLMTDTAQHSREKALFARGNGPRPSPALQHSLGILPAGMLGKNRRHAVLPTGGSWVGKSERSARLVGLLLGDGYVAGRRTILSCADLMLIADIRGDLDALDLKIYKASPDNYDWCISRKNYTPVDNGGIVKGVKGFVSGAYTPFNRKLEELGLRGKHSWDKTIPEEVWSWDDDSVAALIAGYFAADGCVYSNFHKRSKRYDVSIHFGSVSKKMLDTLRLLLLIRFGISASRLRVTAPDTKSRKRALYTLSVGQTSSIKKFTEKIGPHIPGVKRDRLIGKARDIVIKDNNPLPKASLDSATPAGIGDCWDIEVDNEDHLFLLANDLVVSNSTAKGGFMAKTLARAMAAEFVSTPDCGTTNGIDMDIGASDLRGRVLQRETGDFKPGSVLDRNTLSKLRNGKAGKLIVRSPLTCEAENGVCAKCYGVMAEGRFPKVGDHVGIRAATALGEPVTQSALSMKHVTSGKGGTKEYSGLDYLNQFMESPEEFRDRAAVAPVDGHVSDIREAPQGGSILTIGGEDIYVPLDRTIGVKVGDHLEAGEALTDGLVDPEDVLKHRGLGEARRYWAERVGEMATATNAGMDARQFEMLARGVVDHVELDDPVEDGFLPDDKVRYSRWMHRRPIPASAKQAGIKDAVGRYLEQPASHYTVGTRITPKMAQKLSDGGWKEVFVSDEEPGFSPTFVRLQQVAATDDDWLASLGGSYLGANLQQGVTRAQDTNILENIHPTPRLAVGINYAEKLEETGKF
jgi:hypothetical protein